MPFIIMNTMRSARDVNNSAVFTTVDKNATEDELMTHGHDL